MKHLKLFENVGDTFWLVQQGDSFTLYPDEESAKNLIISICNEEIGEYTDDMYFTDVDSALDWYRDEKSGGLVSDVLDYYDVKLQPSYEGDKKLKKMREIKKYNL